MYIVYTRTWWKENKSWPNGLEPCMGRKKRIGECHSEEEAIRICREYNDTRDSGRYSRKAEFMDA